MYQVNYYLNGRLNTVNGTYGTNWVAAYEARKIYEQFHIPTDVMDTTTGEVIAFFTESGNYFADSLLENTVSDIFNFLACQ